MNPFDPDQIAGEFFVGREPQLKRVREQLDSLAGGVAGNICVIGRGGGKTSFLERIVKEAQGRRMVACRCVLDIKKSAEADINNIVEELLGAVDAAKNSGSPRDAHTDRHLAVSVATAVMDADFVLGCRRDRSRATPRSHSHFADQGRPFLAKFFANW